jgi:hypothetical protein
MWIEPTIYTTGKELMLGPAVSPNFGGRSDCVREQKLLATVHFTTQVGYVRFNGLPHKRYLTPNLDEKLIFWLNLDF